MASSQQNPIQRLEELRTFEGQPRQFWASYVEALGGLLGARRCRILFRDHGESFASWKKIGVWADPDAPRSNLSDTDAAALAERALGEGLADAQLSGTDTRLVAVTLKSGVDTHDCVAVAELPAMAEAVFSERVQLAVAAADTPLIYRNFRALKQSQADVTHFASTLDLLVILGQHDKFKAASLALVNELAARFGAASAVLGWKKGNYVRVKAISQMDHFEKKMTRIQHLEAAMEESLDQDDEIVLPAPVDTLRISRDHEILSKEEGMLYLLTVPVRINDKPMAALHLQRTDRPFTEQEIRALWIAAEQVARPLMELKRRDRWFGARWAYGFSEWAQKQYSIDHIWKKIGVITAAIALGVLLFGRITYRVEATFIVRTHQQALLPAPFDGYVQNVYAQIGDAVKTGAVLIQLDDSQLQLERASHIADMRRYRAEAENNQSQQRWANMRVALAQEQQSSAALQLTEHKISAAAIRAPFDAVVVEDARLKEKIGSPVKEGEILMRLARAEDLYLEISVDERDVHEISTPAVGEIAFASQPSLKFPMNVLRVDPVAVPKDKLNVFLVRADFAENPEEWFRPGMTGVAKIEVGPRTFFWILTHRLVDFIQLKLWLF